MISWKIHTERKNFDQIVEAVIQFFPCNGANFSSSTGLWKEKLEESLVIEIIGTARYKSKIKHLANLIKTMNQQEAVLVTATELISFDLL